MRIRIGLNIFIKLLYVGVNWMAFEFTDDLLLKNFKNYGINWARWSRLNHTDAFDFFEGDVPKPGNILLPSFGFCEIQEASMDVRHVFFNRNKFICEISPNILYQYVLIVLWFSMVLSIAISIIGFIMNILGHIITVACFLRDGNPAKKIYKILTLRECEYLTFMRRKNIPVYGEVLRKLRTARHDMKGVSAKFDCAPLTNGIDSSNKAKRCTAPPTDNNDNQWTKI